MTTGPREPTGSTRGDLVAGAATAAVVLALAVVGTWGAGTARGLGLPSPAGWALLTAAAVALVGTRLRPLTVLAVVGALVTAYLATGHPYGPVLLAVGVASYGAARRAPVDRALTVATVVLLALWLPLWWQQPEVPVSGAALDGLVGLLPLTAWVAVPFSAGYARRVRAQAAERSRAFAVQQLVAGERLRLSQDVHDVVGHGLSAIKMQADVALHVMGDRDGSEDPGTAALRAISGSATAALAELREVLGTLGPTRDEPGRAAAARLADLPALRARMADAGLDVHWRVAGSLDGLAPDVDRAAYRVLQEGLTNVLRHGDTAAPVEVEVGRDDDEVRLAVVNRLPPAAALATAGSGLDGMRSRVEALGGTVRAHRDGDRFELRVQVPASGAA